MINDFAVGCISLVGVNVIASTSEWVQRSPPYILSFLLGGVIAYGWTLAFTTSERPVSKRLGGGTLFSLLTGVPLGAFAAWKIDIDALVGVCYVIGAILAIYIAWHRALASFCATEWNLTPVEQRHLREIVRRTLFAEGTRAAEKKANEILNELRNKRQTAAIEALHDFIHAVRDQAADFVAHRQRALKDFLQHHKEIERFQGELRDFYRDGLHYSLPFLKIMFESLIGRDARLWISVRVICKKGDGQPNVYRTFLRTGLTNNDRNQFSIDIPEDSGLPKYLREQHRQNKGIVILNGGAKAKNKWLKSQNDKRNEDVSVIAGPIFAKNSAPPPMTMVLCVNSPIRSVFEESHAPFLKCAVDAISMFVTLVSTDSPLILGVTPLT